MAVQDPVRLAIFDCDGTMVDSQANICGAMTRAFAAHDLPPPDHHRVRRIVGLSLVEAMRSLSPELDMDTHIALAESYKTAFQALRAEGAVAEPLYDGLLSVFDRLRADGWLLAVATGKSDRGLQLCVAHHGLQDYFVSLQTADRHPSKPHPAMVYQALEDAMTVPEYAVVIGDTSFDMEMAINANVRAIGVDWGYHDMQELLDSGAEKVAKSMDELFDILQAGTTK
ncbi:HAD-IA family hydrolase [Parasphingorhabdus sp. DH2-15]|uniref:HAD-IA family hydrolase n=1 Tax=Parasphingorhabdus sp. DH2-15 TaxID=3444112 RepID=UPI003F682A9A